MMDARFILRITSYAAASLMSVMVIVTLVFTSWLYARPQNPKAPPRLRWHMITKNKIEKGTQIKADDVTWKLGRVTASETLIPISKTVVGKYALRDIAANTTCIPELLSDLALADPPMGGAVVPIEVKTSDASSLKPGMHLAFVQADKGVQPATTLLNKQNQPGLELLSMMASTRDAGDTTLLVKISKSDLDSVRLLATGVWRPVILGSPEPVTSTEQKKPAEKKRKRHHAPKKAKVPDKPR
jgi:SAF domain-containing protein